RLLWLVGGRHAAEVAPDDRLLGYRVATPPLDHAAPEGPPVDASHPEDEGVGHALLDSESAPTEREAGAGGRGQVGVGRAVDHLSPEEPRATHGGRKELDAAELAG